MLVTPVRPPLERHAPADEGAGDDSHDLRARDMAVRTEQALREHDGGLDLLPSYQYALGPDGRPYAIEPGERILATEDRGAEDEAEAAAPEPPTEPERAPRTDEHVARSYARFDEVEDAPPELDTIA